MLALEIPVKDLHLIVIFFRLGYLSVHMHNDN